MKILLFGSKGKVGSELLKRLLKDGHRVIALTRKDGDLVNPFQADRLIQHHAANKLDCVINATACNGIEVCHADPELAFTINSSVPAYMAIQCQKYELPFIHFSTDYVFSGTQGEPLKEERPVKPWSNYGWTKWTGEAAALAFNTRSFVFRLSSIYGREYSGPIDALRWVRDGRGTADDPIMVLRQFTAPTSARLVADAIAHVLRVRYMWKMETYGLYHLATSQCVSKKEFSEYICRAVYNKECIVKEGTAVMPRPIHTFLDSTKFHRTFGYDLPTAKKDFELTLPLLIK